MVWNKVGLTVIICFFLGLGSVAVGDAVTLSTGETLTVEIVGQNDTSLIVNHAVLGRLAIPRTSIASVTRDEPASTDVKAPAQAVATAKTAPPSDEGALPKEEKKIEPWKSRFALGFGAEAGNTERANLTIELTMKRERKKSKTALDARYYYSEDRGDRNANKFTAGGVHDWLFPDSPWSFFGDSRYDYDEFNSWEWRLSGHGGLGYQLFDEDDLSVLLRAGAGGAKEFKSKRNQFIPEALFGGELDWKITSRQAIVAKTTFFPDLDDTGEFRNVTSAGWNYKLDDESNMALNLGVYNEFQSKTDHGIDKNDLRIYGGLSFDF